MLAQARSGRLQAHREPTINTPPESVLNLADARLLRAARAGDRRALGQLWDEVVGTLWSVAVGVLSERGAAEAVAAVRERFAERAPGLSLRGAWREDAYSLLWAELAARVEPRPLSGILPLKPEAASAPTGDARERVAAAVGSAPVEVRMIYLFGLLGGCDAATLASLSGEPEPMVRAARGAMAFRILEAMRR